MEFILEFFVNVWLELAMKLVPTNKRHSKKVVLVCKLITVVVILYIIVAFTAGSVILVDNIASRMLGIVLLSSSASIFVCQFVLGIIFFKRHK